MNRLAVKYLDRVSYREGLRWQQETWQKRVAGEICDTLLLLEHDSVFTMGRRETLHNLRVPETQLAAPLEHTDRGGEMTYHGPGQLMGYFHARLAELDDGQGIGQGIGVKELIYRLEEAIILLLRVRYGLEPWRDLEHRGVWLGDENGKAQDDSARKIAALGISIKQGVSLHGFALNVSTDLSYFQQIVPCGIAERGVSSLQSELLRSERWQPELAADKEFLALSKIAGQLLEYFRFAFGYTEIDSIV